MGALFDAQSTGVRAMVLMVASTIALATMHALIRHISQDLHPFEIAFFRNVFGFVALSPLFIRYGFGPLRTRRLGLLSVRAVLNTCVMLSFFYGLSVSPLAVVSALGFSAPVFATLLAILFLGEVVRLRRWLAILVGFAGTMVIVRPGFTTLDPGIIAVLMSAWLWAGALIVIKVLSRTESSLTITAYMTILMAPLSLVPALFFWEWPTLEQWGWLAMIGALGTVGQLTMTEALHLGETSEVMPLDFLKLIWAAVIGFLAFGEIPDLFTWVGGVMIFGAATYIAVRESKMRPGENPSSDRQ